MTTIDSRQWESLDFKAQIGPLLFNIFLGPLRYDYSHISNTYALTKHNHSSYEIHLVIKGSGTITIEDKVYFLSPNSLCIIAPGIYHVVKPHNYGEIKFANFKFSYSEVKKYPDFVHESQKKEFVEIKNIISEINHNFIDNACQIMSLVDQVYSEMSLKPMGYYSKIQSIFSQILIEILRLVSPENKEKYIIPKRSDDDRRNALIETFFDQNYSFSGITVKHLAELLNLSIRQTGRILKTSYGTTFKSKLTEIRIEVAKDLLRNTNLSIQQISEKTGYSSPTYFHKVFKDKTKMTPQNYQNSGGHD